MMMKKHFLTTIGLVCSATMAIAQTMNIQTGNITTAVSSQQAGDMVYTNGGSELTVQGKTFTVSDITRIYIDDSTVDDNTVSVSYNGTSAQVVVAGNIAQYLTTTVSGAHVSIVQSADVTDEITYTLSGTSTDGSFTMDGKLKATVVLNGVSLTSSKGAAIDIENGKRIDIVVAEGTTNSFADYAAGAQKACFFVNGHAEFSGAGTINLTGNAKHAYRSDEYTKLKKSFTGVINVLSSASDGLHIEQYLEMNCGTVTISGVKGDAVDVAATSDATDEYNGQIFINGGLLTATASGEDVKVLKSDADIAITGGTIKLTATGAGSKAIGTKGALTVSSGKVETLALGNIYNEGKTDESKPNAIKATGVITISGGEVYSVSKNKAFNTDVSSNGFVINGGKVMGIGAKATPSVTGSQASKTYTRVSVASGQTVSYNGISYTVPTGFAISSAYVLVSPGGSSARNSDQADNNVAVVWSESSATVDIADNIADLVSANINGANVTLIADDAVADEIVYTLSGTSSDGSFYMNGNYKSTVVLSGLTLTSTDSAAINIRNGKRIKVVIAADTKNTLADAANGSQKACFMVKGHTHFQGTGSLTIKGNTKHAFWGDEYVLVESGNIEVTTAKTDGFNINQYYQQTGGAVTISGVADDGLAVNYDTDSNNVRKTDAENTGSILLQGGTLNVTVSGLGSKAVKAAGPISISEEVAATTLLAKATGGVKSTTSGSTTTYKASTALKSDTSITIDEGTLTLTATGQGGRAMLSEGTLTVNGGTITARAEGANYGSSSGGGNRPGGGGGWGGGWPGGGGSSSSSNSKNAKGIKSKGDMLITGGTINAYSAKHEGIESKAKMTITGGIVYSEAYDDAINSSGDMTISGGYVFGNAQNNDGIDANGNMKLEGGVVIGFGAGGAEAGIDVAERKTMTFTGGQIFGIGGRIDGSPTSTTGSQAYGTATVSASGSGYFVLSAKSGSTYTPIFAIQIPSGYSRGSSILVSSASMTSGNSYAITRSTSVSGTAVNGFIAAPTVNITSGTSFTAKK